jgi:hypothetical protein
MEDHLVWTMAADSARTTDHRQVVEMERKSAESWESSWVPRRAAQTDEKWARSTAGQWDLLTAVGKELLKALNSAGKWAES